MVAAPLLVFVFALGVSDAYAQTPSKPDAPPAAQAPVAAPPGYVIGADDVLSIVFWFEKDMSGEVIVRPDGKISLPLLNEVQASGLTPEQLRASLQEAAQKYVEDGTVAVLVKAINSRKVFITGEVAKPGAYPLAGPTTVLHLIAMAGGLGEYADEGKIVVLRTDNGKPVSYRFNYNDVLNRRNVEQNIELKPGDTVVVP
jgi:polysaccharide export outer membrane protein